MAQVLLIMASVRPSRIADQIAAWIEAQNTTALGIEIIDLRDWHLPMDDEPNQPKQMGLDGYTQPHTRAWSAKVRAADGFIFAFPQYNWGYPAPLKNALDHLYDEWKDKPAISVSYGSRGGNKAADQFAQVAQGMHIELVPTRVELPLKDAARDADLRLIDPDGAFAAQAGNMRQSLAELAAALARN